jgi:23S rRNA pseudouridine2605 synthase
MSQDSEKNDRDRSTGSSRDGDPQRRAGRSTDRRDDGRKQGDDRPRSGGPRFSRDTDRPTFSRDGDKDRSQTGGSRTGESRSSSPGFNRDSNNAGGRSDKPARFSRDTDNRSNSDRPRRDAPRQDGPSRFSRDSNQRSDDRRSGRGDSDSRSPRFERGSGDRPDFNRTNRFQSDKPRFDSDRRDSRDGENRRGREESSGKASGSGFRPSGPPRFNRDDKPRFSTDRNRDDSNRDGKPAGPPRFGRTDGPRDANRFGDSNKDGASRFSRGQSRGNRPDKPAFKRVGGFSPEADERNRERFNDDTSRSNNRDEDSRFTGQQRKESGDRRTGMYTKAPNYNLEESRNRFAGRGRTDGPRGDRKQDDEKPKRVSVRDRTDGSNTTRLNRYIANSGVCSRREADELITRGDISVNGKVVTEMGFQVKEGDTVKYGTKALSPERFVYVLLNKPKDYITTTEDPDERKTVMELVADAGNFRMYPVGRLDRNTTGLLLFTNDGELADKLTHPSNNVRKIYQVELDKPITTEHFEELKKGIELEDGPIKPDALSIVTPDAYVVGIEIHSGRNRIVRRMFEHFGYEVSKLDRTTYAGLTKKELPRGKWRFLDPKEVVKLKYLS